MTLGTARHAAHVIETVHSKSAAAQCRIAASWRRSMMRHKLDPENLKAPLRVTDRELTNAQDRNRQLLTVARNELDALFALVQMSGCAVLITDASGLVLDRRAATGDTRVFDGWGLRSGVNWSEARDGTNGIGTCLAEARALTIHRSAHFHAKHTSMSCIDAPIFDADGRLVAALDISSARSDQTEGMNCLLLAAVTRSAHQIETALFRSRFPTARIMALQDGQGPMLLAVDEDDLVLGATRAARQSLGLELAAPIDPRPAADLLGMPRERTGIEGAEYAALRRALSRSGGNASAAAKALGVSRATFYRRMKRVGLSTDGETCLSSESPSATRH